VRIISLTERESLFCGARSLSSLREKFKGLKFKECKKPWIPFVDGDDRKDARMTKKNAGMTDEEGRYP